MKVSCMAHKLPVEFANDALYLKHLQEVHGNISPGNAMTTEKMKQQNIPASLPPGIPPEALPTAEFMEVANAIDNQPEPPAYKPVTPYLTAKSLSEAGIKLQEQPIVEVKPINLQYAYTGNCSHCKNSVRTIMIETKGTLVANCYCITCDKTLDQREVYPIPPFHNSFVKSPVKSENEGIENTVSKKKVKPRKEARLHGNNGNQTKISLQPEM